MATWSATMGAVVLRGGVAAVLFPGCTIHLGQGTGNEEAGGEETPPESTQGTGGAAGTGDETPAPELTPEEQATLEAIQNAGPQEIAQLMATSYAAVGSASLVESQIQDPATVDQAMLDQLIDQVVPVAWDNAQAWLASLDPSAIPLQSITPDPSCPKEPYSCPWTTECPYNGGRAGCLITHCGTGTCPWCPWDLGNIVVTSWCSYGCQQGTQLVAGAFILRTRYWGNSGPYCKSL